MQPVGDLLERAALHPGLVVVDPQPAGERDGDGGEADAACEGQEVVEDWDGFGEDELSYSQRTDSVGIKGVVQVDMLTEILARPNVNPSHVAQ